MSIIDTELISCQQINYKLSLSRKGSSTGFIKYNNIRQRALFHFYNLWNFKQLNFLV